MKIRLKRVHNRKGIILAFLYLLLALSGSILVISFFVFRFRPVFEEKAECAAKNKANSIINNAVTEVLDGITTEDFVNIISGENNIISSINTNTMSLNEIKTRLYNSLTNHLKEANESVVYIPIGSLTKYPALQGLGYKIPVKILFDTTFNVYFSKELSDAGINQVYYETYIVASANLDIISAFIMSETTVTSKIPISQTLIVGTVPAHYGFLYEETRR